jgi:hypothetical protein
MTLFHAPHNQAYSLPWHFGIHRREEEANKECASLNKLKSEAEHNDFAKWKIENVI